MVAPTVGAWVLHTDLYCVILHKMVCEFLLGRLGDHSLLPEVRVRWLQILRMVVKDGFDKPA